MEIESGDVVKTLVVTGGKIWGVSFSADGKFIAFCRTIQGKKCFAEVYELSTWQPLVSVRVAAEKSVRVNQWGRAGAVGRITRFTPDGNHLLVAGGICIRANPHGYRYACQPTQLLWRVDLNPPSSQRLYFDRTRGSGTCIAVSPDGKYVVVGNGPIERWDVLTGKQMWKRDGGNGVAITPDGKHVVVSAHGEEGVAVLDAKTGKTIRKISDAK